MKTQKIKLFAAQMISRWAQDSKELAEMLAEIKGDKKAISQLGIAGSKVRLILEGMGAGGGKVLHPNHVQVLANAVLSEDTLSAFEAQELAFVGSKVRHLSWREGEYVFGKDGAVFDEKGVEFFCDFFEICQNDPELKADWAVLKT
jgi:hypothetical protein